MTRDVTDADGTAWTFAQAYAGLGDTPVAQEAAQRAAERAAEAPGAVAVVATPSGGEMSVRLELPIGWADRLADDELLTALAAARR